MMEPPVVLAAAEGYERVAHLQSGAFGMAYLERDVQTGEEVAIKYIPRGATINVNVQRETVSHRLLRHPNIIAFKKALLTPTHLAIVMEFAGGGELFNRIASSPAQRFSEAQARFFFVQLLAGISYVHSQAMAHRDLKLENALLMDASPRPRLAICDFGYTKSETLHSAFHTGNVGTPSYLAPELLTLKQGENYDGKAVDAWAAGVVLYVMLVGGYPFGDLSNGRELVRRIATAQYSLPVPLSPECVALFATIFVVDPSRRATIGQMQGHPWCTADPHPVLPWLGVDPPGGLQSVEQLMALLHEAQKVPPPQGGRGDDEEAAPGGDYGMPYTEADHVRDLEDLEGDGGDED